ncbi:MAG: hypothetical protein ACI37Z_09270 [Candidatus Gastranaerophilaceae bacterium]
MNLNEECLLQYLVNPNNSENFILQSGFKYESSNSSEYNEVAWLFV